jgi:hypothetical protein
MVSIVMASGEPLAEVQREAEQALAFARKARFGLAADSLVAQLILVRVLRGQQIDDLFEGAGQDELAQRLNEGGARLALAASRYWIYKLQANKLSDAISVMKFGMHGLSPTTQIQFSGWRSAPCCG